MNKRVVSGLVAEHVMGWMADNHQSLPDFAADRSLAWQITDAMSERGYIWTIGSGEYVHEKIAAVFHKPDDPNWSDLRQWGSGEDVAIAVSLAALKALGVEVPK